VNELPKTNMKTLNLIKFSLIAAVTLMLAGCDSISGSGGGASAADQQKRQQAMASSDHLIVPGERIGPIRLGMGMDEVAATLGQPDVAYKPFTGHDFVTWNYLSLNLIVNFSEGAAPTVTSIKTTAWSRSGQALPLASSTWADFNPINAVFQTANGVELGSTSFEAARAYSSYSYQQDSYSTEMNFNKLGIQFVIEQADHKITCISIFQNN
jgi:hypothetical protein